MTLLTLRPPAPEPIDAPAGTFSAARAMATVTAIAGQPRPLGSPAGDAVRDLLVGRLRAQGLDARVTTSVGPNVFGGEATVGRVENIIATLPGTDPTGAVVLAAHYDSVAAGPGAADDGAGVAAIVETVRTLRTQAPLRNDLVVLLTDGEEPGLLGAQAFVRDDPLRARPVVVLNWEARGVSGPSLLFQTSPGNARLVEAFAAAAPHPAGDSSAVEAYRFLPNDTDLSEFLDAGRPGMNFAFIEGAARYHTPGDTPANLSAASVQHHGSSMLGLAVALGGTDLAPFDPAVSGAEPVGDVTYFPFLGVFVTYPGALVLPIAITALLVTAAAVLLARRHGLLSLRRLFAGAVSLLFPLLLAGLLGQGLWVALVALRPAYGDGAGFLHRPLLPELAVLALAGFALVVWGLLLRRRIGAWALGLGAAGWLAALGGVTAALVPGVSFQFALPALG
ncbi:MAG: M20/M25/M40 family metallo-hydrolase, partial [Actinomycetota bacterium]|nr:M20/M25/M40 family metallo-hydrolase [Actinomycetota bacterium]